MANQTLLEATALASASLSFALPDYMSAANIISTGYGDGEYATLQIYNPLTSEFVDFENSGATYILSSTNTSINFNMQGRYRFNKTLTDNPVGITIVSAMKLKIN